MALITATLATARLGPYQLQAAIAAVHDEAAGDQDTDWPQVLALYDLMDRLWPSPMVTLNRAVAVAMVRGPQAGLDEPAALAADEHMADHHRVHSVRAHLLELAGEPRRPVPATGEGRPAAPPAWPKAPVTSSSAPTGSPHAPRPARGT